MLSDCHRSVPVTAVLLKLTSILWTAPSIECRQAAQSVEHWLLECAAIHEAREDIFERSDLSLNIPDSDSQKAMALAERTVCLRPLWRVRHQQQQQQQEQQQQRYSNSLLSTQINTAHFSPASSNTTVDALCQTDIWNFLIYSKADP